MCRHYKLFILALAVFGLVKLSVATEMDHSPAHHQHQMAAAPTPLQQAGNSGFAAIQEAVNALRADPNTDWQKVDLEALRQHLIDMQNFTYHVSVVSQKPVANGVQFTVKANNAGAAKSLKRLFSAHPAVLKQESGWDMKVKHLRNGSYRATVTSESKKDVAQIRGLGYIGLIAFGAHHPAHHWLIATGQNPHQHMH